MPAGELGVVGGVTVFRTKLAVTVVGSVRVIEQLASVLEQPIAFPVPLLQPIKFEPLLPAAWRTRVVPVGYRLAQTLNCTPPLVLQLTIPIPFPVVKIDTVTGEEAPGNKAVTVVSAFTITTHGPVPEQPP